MKNRQILFGVARLIFALLGLLYLGAGIYAKDAVFLGIGLLFILASIIWF